MKPSQLLREKGWCQGGSALMADGTLHKHIPITGEPVAYCLVGACNKAYPFAYPHWGVISDRLATHLGINQWGLSLWNDTPGRTKEEVISALEAIGE